MFVPWWLLLSPTWDASPHSSLHFLTGQLITMMSLLPDGVVGSAEVDEEIPAPVSHGQQVSHAAKIHGEQTGTTPDGGHSPGCHPHIWILHSQGLHLPVQVVGALEKAKITRGLPLKSRYYTCVNKNKYIFKSWPKLTLLKTVDLNWCHVTSACLPFVAHLIDVYVVVVRGVVDGFEEALELAGGSSMHHQNECYSHRLRRKALSGVLIPLDVGVGFTCEVKKKDTFCVNDALDGYFISNVIRGLFAALITKLHLPCRTNGTISHYMMGSTYKYLRGTKKAKVEA